MNRYHLISCVWEFTLACNLRCIHCGSTAGKKREDELSTDEAIKLCYDLKKTGCKSIALMGGEPFLRKDFWIVARKIRELEMELSVITNGTVYNEDTFKELKKLDIQALATSIDGANPKTHDKIRGVDGAFNKTISFIEKALSYDLPVSVITTVSKLNISELDGIKDLIKGRNIAWQVQIAGSEGERFDKSYLLSEEEFYSVGLFIEALRRKYSIRELPVIGAHDMGYNSCIIRNIYLYDKWKGCQAGISVVGIRSNGDVLGCLSINNDKYVEGNVRKKSLYDIWNDEKLFSYTRNFKIEDIGENCKNCKYIEDCKGGCSEMSLSKTDVFHNDPYCFYRIELRNMSFLKRKYLEFVSKMYSKKDIKFLEKIFCGIRK
jgi:radical SAM protein with 4Fe4S-binding SPASM domain